jgi:hypothetical protein
MKKIVIVILSACPASNAFVGRLHPPSAQRDVSAPFHGARPSGEGRLDPLARLLMNTRPRNLEEAHKEWKEEANHLKQMERSVMADPDLATFVEPNKKTRDPAFLDKEAHRHDSFLAEVEHSIDTDPDLSNVAGCDGYKAMNAAFVEREAHVHDSLLDGIEHSLDTDPDLNIA